MRNCFRVRSQVVLEIAAAFSVLAAPRVRLRITASEVNLNSVARYQSVVIYYGRPAYSRCGHYIIVLWFVMVALWNRADHYVFINVKKTVVL